MEFIRGENNSDVNEPIEEPKPHINQEQIHDILFNREIGWQEIIYDLINTEQLDPWDVNLTILSEKYLIKIQELEEADFFVSSKVLLAASLLLRIKSEILLNKYIKSIDDILFGRKAELTVKSTLERIELEDEIPELIPRSPMPRYKKVTLKELIESLNKAIITENRRIKKEIVKVNALKETSISLPKRQFNIKDKINQIYAKLTDHFSKQNEHKKITYTEFSGIEKEQRIENFSPLLHLENQKKVWLEQDAPFDEIHIWEKQNFWKIKGDPFKEIIEQLKDGTYKEEFDESAEEIETPEEDLNEEED